MTLKTARIGQAIMISAFCGSVILTAGIVAVLSPQSSDNLAPVAQEQQLHNAKRTVTAATKKKRPHLAAQVSAPTLLPIVQNDSITKQHQVIADKVLRALPSGCRDNLQTFYVLYKDAKQRGLGGKSTIIIDGTPGPAEFAALLVHECGHVIHGNMLGNARTGKTAFRDGQDTFYNDSPAAQFFAISWQNEQIMRMESESKDFVSGYAESDAFEDFSETFAFYVLHHDAFRLRAMQSAALANKLVWMETYLPLPENVLGQSSYVWNGDIPWDITKLQYALAK